MRLVRTISIGIILLNLALVTVYLEVANVRLRFACSKAEQKYRQLALERRTLMNRVATASRPGVVAERAAALGINVRRAEHRDMDRLNRGSSGARNGGADLAAGVDRR